MPSALSIILRVAYFIVTVYLYLVVFRVIVAWFSPLQGGRLWEFVRRLTDPVLNLFRGLRFLRRGDIDFTPLPALFLLQMTAFVCSYLSAAREITLPSLLAALALAVWRILFSLLLFFTLVAAVRLAGLLWSRRPSTAFFRTLDGILAPLALASSRLIPRGRQADYRVILTVLLILLLTLVLMGILFAEPALRLLCLRSGVALWL